MPLLFRIELQFFGLLRRSRLASLYEGGGSPKG